MNSNGHDVSADELARAFQLHSRVATVRVAEGIWALHKPTRVLSHPNPPAREAPNAILRVLYDTRDEAFVSPESEMRAYLLHRLDQDTSGLILLALDLELAAELKELFYHREIKKQYHALVRGIVAEREGVWRDALEKSRRGRGGERHGGGRTSGVQVEVVRGRPPNAETRFRVLETFPALGATLLALFPETGRTHQLRVQSAARGHPIAGDERYGDFRWNRELKSSIDLRRMYLHAARMEFRHPGSGRRWKLVADADRSIEAPLEALRAGRPGRKIGGKSGKSRRKATGKRRE